MDTQPPKPADSIDPHNATNDRWRERKNFLLSRIQCQQNTEWPEEHEYPKLNVEMTCPDTIDITKPLESSDTQEGTEHSDFPISPSFLNAYLDKFPKKGSEESITAISPSISSTLVCTPERSTENSLSTKQKSSYNCSKTELDQPDNVEINYTEKQADLDNYQHDLSALNKDLPWIPSTCKNFDPRISMNFLSKELQEPIVPEKNEKRLLNTSNEARKETSIKAANEKDTTQAAEKPISSPMTNTAMRSKDNLQNIYHSDYNTRLQNEIESMLTRSKNHKDMDIFSDSDLDNVSLRSISETDFNNNNESEGQKSDAVSLASSQYSDFDNDVDVSKEIDKDNANAPISSKQYSNPKVAATQISNAFYFRDIYSNSLSKDRINAYLNRLDQIENLAPRMPDCLNLVAKRRDCLHENGSIDLDRLLKSQASPLPNYRNALSNHRGIDIRMSDFKNFSEKPKEAALGLFRSIKKGFKTQNMSTITPNISSPKLNIDTRRRNNSHHNVRSIEQNGFAVPFSELDYKAYPSEFAYGNVSKPQHKRSVSTIPSIK